MQPYAIGIDVGGTKIAAGLVRRDGTILTRYNTHAHSEQQPEIVIAAIVQAYQAVIEQSRIDRAEVEAIGLGFGGNTNGPAGIILVSSNLPAWNNIPLRDIVAEQVGHRVILDNDTNMGALGEHRYGAGRNTQNMGYVTFSTGYGMGIIINNRLYVGHAGTAGELGHVVIDVGGPACTCGKDGCLMAYASGVGISRMVYDQVRSGTKTLLREMVPPDGKRVAGEVVAQAAKQGDEAARAIIRQAGYYAGIGLSMIVQVLNPELIVYGGGLTHIGPMIMEPVMAAMKEHSQPELLDMVRVVPWQLGNDLGIIGAAARVFAETEADQPGLLKAWRATQAEPRILA